MSTVALFGAVVLFCLTSAALCESFAECTRRADSFVSPEGDCYAWESPTENTLVAAKQACGRHGTLAFVQTTDVLQHFANLAIGVSAYYISLAKTDGVWYWVSSSSGQSYKAIENITLWNGGEPNGGGPGGSPQAFLLHGRGGFNDAWDGFYSTFAAICQYAPLAQNFGLVGRRVRVSFPIISESADVSNVQRCAIACRRAELCLSFSFSGLLRRCVLHQARFQDAAAVNVAASEYDVWQKIDQ